MSNYINITNIIGSPLNGGVQNFILTLAKNDKKFRIKRSVICLYSIKGSLKKEFLDKDINLYLCPIILNDNGLRPYFLWKKIRIFFGKILFPIKLTLILLKVKTRILICHEPKKLLEISLVSKLLSILFLNHMHKELDYFKNFLFFSFIFKNSNFISDSPELSNSNIQKSHLELDFIDNIPIITSTGSLENFSSQKRKITDNIVKIGSVGRFNWEKNYQQVVSIVKELKHKSQIKFKISIVGYGPDFKRIKALIKQNSLEDTIFLKGEMMNSEVIDFLNNLDIYIQTSISEGSPLTIKEAMASSLIVISSNVGGINSLIKNNVDGFLVKKNDTDDFVNTILNVMNMKKEKKIAMGAKARERVLDKYSPEKIAKKYFDHITTLLKEDN